MAREPRRSQYASIAVRMHFSEHSFGALPGKCSIPRSAGRGPPQTEQRMLMSTAISSAVLTAVRLVRHWSEQPDTQAVASAEVSPYISGTPDIAEGSGEQEIAPRHIG